MSSLGNGRALLDLRKQKKVPAGLILVSFVGTLPVSNFTLYATPGRTYDWRVVKELRVCALIDHGLGTAADLAPITAHALHGECHVWHVSTQRGAWIYPATSVDARGVVRTRADAVDTITWTRWQSDRFGRLLANNQQELGATFRGIDQ
jgi:hypothetical protein